MALNLLIFKSKIRQSFFIPLSPLSCFDISIMHACLISQSCPTLCDPRDPQPTRLLCPWGFSRQEYWSGLPCPPPGDLPNPGIEPGSPALQVDSLPAELPGKPHQWSYKLNWVKFLLPLSPLPPVPPVPFFSFHTKFIQDIIIYPLKN